LFLDFICYYLYSEQKIKINSKTLSHKKESIMHPLARVCDLCLALQKQKLFAQMDKAQITNLRQRGGGGFFLEKFFSN
jgi:hypothetical protein